MSVANKSGTYSYYETDEQNKCIILITGTNIDVVTHAAKSINKTGINPVGGNITLDNMTNQTNNTTTDTSITESSSSKHQTSNNKNSESSGHDSVDFDVERTPDAPYGRSDDGTPFSSDSERKEYYYEMTH